MMPSHSSMFAIVVCLSAASASADDLTVSPDALAEAYGLPGWNQIEQIEFTFNVELPNGKAITRAWWLKVKAGEILLKQPTQNPVHPSGYQLIQTTDPQHAQFINDSYWLLFPFQLVWSNPHVTRHEQQPLPIGEGEGMKWTAQWPDEGGYTPGDAYDLYLGDDGLIQQWVFRRGGKPEGNAHTWEDHQQLGSIIVSLDHHGPEGSGFRLWFTEVKATLTDGTVVTPQPIVEP